MVAEENERPTKRKRMWKDENKLSKEESKEKKGVKEKEVVKMWENWHYMDHALSDKKLKKRAKK